MGFSVILPFLAAMLFGGREATAPDLLKNVVNQSRVGAKASVQSMDFAALGSRFKFDVGGETYVVDAPRDGEMELRENGFLRTFKIAGSGSTSFVTVQDGLAFGIFYAPEGMFVLRADGHEAKLEQPAASELHCEVVKASALGIKAEAQIMPSRRHAARTGTMPVTIRLLEVYSTDALAGAGSAQAIEVQIQAAVDQLNQIAKDSGAGMVQFVLAKAAPVNYTDMQGQNLVWLGADPGVAALRKQYQADLVVLWTEHGQDLAFAPVIDADFSPASGFSVVGRDVALTGLAHAHELGHNLGMHHNIESPFGPKEMEYPFARGYHDQSVRRQTIMGDYFDSSGLFYTHIPRFSNPDLFYSDKFTPSFRTGSETANNARMLREKAAVVAQYHLQLTQ